MLEVTILAASPHGLELARRLRKGLGRGSLVDASADTARTLQRAFGHGRPLVCILSLETVFRTLGPMLLSPSPRPPVLVADEEGRFVVEVLSGKGSEELLTQAAKVLGGLAVVTRPSPLHQVPAAHLIGRGWGWKVEGHENLDRVGELARDQPVAVFQDAGRADWWKPFGPWPGHFERLGAWPSEARWKALLVISDRILEAPPAGLEQVTIVYRPPTLTLGVSCPPGISLEEFEEAVKLLFERERLSLSCLTALASAAAAREEEGLIDFAERYAIPHLAYPSDKLALLHPQPGGKANGSAMNDCEPAAMLAAGVRELLVPKAAVGRVLLAVARRPHA